MTRPTPRDSDDLTAALLFLRRIALEGAGYELRGVRGWAHLVDIRRATGHHLAERLGLLHARRMAERRDVRPPGLARPVYVYRITPEGADAVAGRWGLPRHPLTPPGLRDPAPPRVYLSPAAADALLTLREAHADPGAPLRFGGQAGWVTGAEARERVRRWNAAHAGRYRGLDPGALQSLRRLGLAERHDDWPGWGREIPVVHWRASDIGREIAPLEWREAGDEAAAMDDMAFDFTDEELFEAFRLVLPAVEARADAAAILDALSRAGDRATSEDVLLLLSLATSGGRLKADRIRGAGRAERIASELRRSAGADPPASEAELAIRLREAVAAEDRRWEDRRREMRRILRAAGKDLPEDDP